MPLAAQEQLPVWRLSSGRLPPSCRALLSPLPVCPERDPLPHPSVPSSQISRKKFLLFYFEDLNRRNDGILRVFDSIIERARPMNTFALGGMPRITGRPTPGMVSFTLRANQLPQPTPF